MSRILHLSDIHFGCENKAAVAAVAECAHGGGFDLIVITGDVTQFGETKEFAAAKAWVDALPQPVLLVPGNHDTPYAGIVDRLAAPFARYERHFGPAWRTGHAGVDFAVQGFNTARGVQIRLNWSKGAADLDHARDVGAALSAVAGLRIAACHHPLMEVVGGPMTGNVRGGKAAAGALAEAGVDLVLSGHVHTPFALTLPCNDGRTHAVGAATLSLRERGAPAGFNLIDWDAETIDVRAQGWTGSHFETVRTWALPRRARA